MQRITTKVTTADGDDVVLVAADNWERLQDILGSKYHYGSYGYYIVFMADAWDSVREWIRKHAAGRIEGGCTSWCQQACSDDGGCDVAFGTSGSCGALCQNGEVYLEV